MRDDKIQEILDEHAQRRRQLLKNSAKVAVTAPAAALLLADGVKPALAQDYGTAQTTIPVDLTTTTPD